MKNFSRKLALSFSALFMCPMLADTKDEPYLKLYWKMLKVIWLTDKAEE
jgi:hypothetical protein